MLYLAWQNKPIIDESKSKLGIESLVLISTNRVEKGEFYLVAQIYKHKEVYTAKMNEVIFPAIKQSGNSYKTIDSAKAFVMECLQESLDEIIVSFIFQLNHRGTK